MLKRIFILLTLMISIIGLTNNVKAETKEFYDLKTAPNVTVINFHFFGTENINKNLENIRNSKEQFHEYLSYFKENGYTTISEKELIQYINGNQQIPKKSILITIDDGFLSVYEEAFPVLKELNMKAVFFPIVADMLRGDRKGSPMVNFNQLQEMIDSGLVELGNHTYDLHWRGNGDISGHEAMILNYDRNNKIIKNRYEYILADFELAESFIEKSTTQEVKSISYPYGVFDSQTILAAKKLNYEIGYTTKAGVNYFGYGKINNNHLEVHRIGSNSKTTKEKLLEQVKKYDSLGQELINKNKDILILKDKSEYIVSTKNKEKENPLKSVKIEIYTKVDNGLRIFDNQEKNYSLNNKNSIKFSKDLFNLNPKSRYSFKITIKREDNSSETEWIDL